MRTSVIISAIGLSVQLLASCSLPQGAARTSQVLDGVPTDPAQAKAVGIAVVNVGRANVAQINSWPSSDPDEKTQPWPARSGAANTITLAPGDQLSLKIWDNDPNALLTAVSQGPTDLGALSVASNGTVTLPYAGAVKVAGLSEERALDHIRTEIRKVQPTAEVQLNLQPGRLNSIAMVSGVSSPGSYGLPAGGGLPLMTMIARSGGIAPSLKYPQVQLTRGNRIYQTSADNLLHGQSADVMLQGGDRVAVIEDPRSFTMLGASGSEQLVSFDRDQLTALQALAKTGGLAPNRADLKGVLVLRDYNKSTVRANGPEAPSVIYALDLTSADGLFAARNFTVLPGDTVLATESPVVSARTVLGLVGTIFGLNNQLQ